MQVPPVTSVGRVAPPNVPLRYSQLAPGSSAFGAAIATGLGNLGSAIQARGEALSSNRNQEGRVKANGQLIAFQLEQDRVLDSLNRNSQEFSAIDEGYSNQFVTKADDLLKTAPDEETKAYLQNELINLYGTNTLHAQGLERKRNEDATGNALNIQAETARNIVRNNPAMLDEQVDKLSAAINGSVGVMPTEDLRERTRLYLQGMAESAVMGRIDQNPALVKEELKLGTLQSGADALIYRESGGDPTAMNAQGYAGLYQFGAARLSDLGVYSPSGKEDLAANKWTGSFNIPDFPQVKTLNDFLASSTAQHAVYELHRQKMDEEIKSNGFDNYIGKQVNGVLITTQGLYNMLHLGGVESTKSALAGNDKKDANGTSVLDYAAMGSSAIELAGGLNAVLTPEQKERLAGAADATIRQQQADAARAEDDAWQEHQRQQDTNATTLQAGIANNQVTDPMLANAVSRQLINGEQYRTLQANLHRDKSDEGDDEVALEMNVRALKNELTVDEVMARDDLSIPQKNGLINTIDESGRRGGVLARADVKRQIDRLESIVGGSKSPFGIYEDQTANERVVNAMQEAIPLMQQNPDQAEEIATKAIDRWRKLPANFDTLPKNPYFGAPFLGTRSELGQRLLSARDKVNADHVSHIIDDTSYLRTLSDLERYLKVIQGLPEQGLVVAPPANSGQ